MDKKRLLINLLTTTISYSTTILIAFFLTPYLISTLGKDAYSFYPLANSFVNYMSIITVALNSMASRFITIEIVKKNWNKANSYFVSVFYSNIILSGFLLIIMSLIIIFIERLLDVPVNLVPSVKLLFLLVFISMIVNILTGVFSVAVFAKNRTDLRSVIEIIQGILRVAIYIILFTFFKPSIVYVGVVSLCLSIVYFICHFALSKKLLPEMKLSFHFFQLKAIKEVLSSGIWNSVNQLGSILLTSLSLLIFNIYFGAEAAGDYSIVLTVPNFINGIISMLTSIFMPVLMHKYAEENIKLVVKEVQNSQKLMGLVTNILVVEFMVVGKEFFSLWVPGEDAHKLQILSLMTIGHLIFTGVTWPISNLNTVLNKVKVPSLYMVGSGFVNICIMLLFIKFTNLGIYSVSLSALIVNIVWVGVFVPIYPCKDLGVKKTTFFPPIIKTLAGGVIIYGISSIIKMAMPITNWMGLLLVIFMSSIVGLIINIIIIFKPSEIKEIVKKVHTKLKLVMEGFMLIMKPIANLLKYKKSNMTNKNEKNTDGYKSEYSDKNEKNNDGRDDINNTDSWKYNVNTEQLKAIFNDLRKQTRNQLRTYTVQRKKQYSNSRIKRVINHNKTNVQHFYWPNGLLAISLEWSHWVSNDIKDFYSLIEYYDRWIQNGASINHLAYAINGYSLIYIYELTKEDRYKQTIEKIINYLYMHPTDKNGCLSHKKVKPNDIYIDSIGMTCPFLCRYGKLYKDPKATDLAIKQIVDFFEYGFDSTSSLPYHGYNATENLKYGIIGWGRAVGWLLIGMIDSLEYIEITHSKYAYLCEVFKNVLNTVLKYQMSSGHFAWQITSFDGHIDTSTTAMISYAVIRGVMLNILDKSCQYQALLGLKSLEPFILNGKVTNSSAEHKGFGMYPQKYGAFPWSQGPTTALTALSLQEVWNIYSSNAKDRVR